MMKRMLAMLLTAAMLCACAAAEDIATPTDLTEAPAPAATEQPAPEPTPEPWNEAQCDHANEHCTQAPSCTAEGCAHIGRDANGLDIPLCDKGRWLLDQQDMQARTGLKATARTVRNQVIDLGKADAAIYRSGSYKVVGGKEGSKLTIAAGRLVVLDMTDARLGELSLGSSADLTWHTHGENHAAAVKLGQGSQLKLPGSGALTIGKVTLPGDGSAGVRITGGSVRADVKEKSGRTMHAFPAEGMTAVLVEGESLRADRAHTDGSVCLWLQPAGEGHRWSGKMNGTVLEITREADLPPAVEGGIIQGEENVLEPGSYELSGPIAEGTRLVIPQEGVTLRLTDAVFSGVLTQADVPYVLYARGENHLGGLDGSVTIHAQGRLVLDKMPERAFYHGGAVVLPAPPAGWQITDVQADKQTVTLDGEALPLLCSPEGWLYLPEPGENATYAISVTHEQIIVQRQENQERHFTLTDDEPHANAGSAPFFTVRGGGSYVTGSITAGSAKARAEFRQVKVQSPGAALVLDNEHLSVKLYGDNGLIANGGSAIELKGDSSLALEVVTGRLLVRQQNQTRGLTLKGNIKLEPESSQEHLHLIIRDSRGNPVPNTDMTLLIGGQSYEYTTHFDGSIHLWGMGDLAGQSIAATNGQEVYTAVVAGSSADVHTGLTIKDEIITEEYGALTVLFTCEGAESVGVQALIGEKEQSMPDDFVPEAKRFTGADGAVTITGVEPGKTISLRVYAASAEGVELTAENADGFQFGRLMHITTRQPWSPNGSADAVYTGKTYQSPLDLPENAQVTYTGAHLHNGLPLQVGKYTMHVTIPQGDARWLPGTVDVPFEIKRITLTIRPEPNQQKYQGQPDPAFAYTVEGLLSGDEVTGRLQRQPGEDVGNYAFTLEEMTAADYYRLRMAADAAEFTILPAPVMGGGYWGVFEVLRPVRQTITRRDGRRLEVILNTQDALHVNYSVFGQVVLGSDDGQPRPFSPSLSWKEESDRVLLRVMCEAEMNKDRGYQTDAYGNPLWTGRQLRMGWMGLRHLKEIGVDALALINGDAALIAPLDAFLSLDMEKLVKENNGNLSTVRFRLELTPADAPADLQPVSRVWNAAVAMLIDGRETEITAQVPGLTVCMDMEPTAALLESMGSYDGDAFAAGFTLYLGAETLPAALVEPFTPAEMETADYPQVLHTHRYLHAPLTQAGSVCVANVTEAAE